MIFNNKKRKAITLCVMFFCCYLSFGLFELLIKEKPITQSLPVFKQLNTVKIQELTNDAEQLREQYGYMVFRKERAEIERKLISNIQQQINLQPFESNLWRELMFLQANDKTQKNAIERQWTFLVSKTFLQWNPHERLTLLKRCVFFSSDIYTDVSNACAELFTYVLHKNTVDKLARKLDLTPSKLQSVLIFFGVDADQV